MTHEGFCMRLGVYQVPVVPVIPVVPVVPVVPVILVVPVAELCVSIISYDCIIKGSQ